MPADRPKIAAIITAFYPLSHADVLLVKFLKGFPTDDGLIEPRVDVASMFIDQPNALGRGIGTAVANASNIPLYENVEAALTLGGKELAVDGVLLIGEHGDYPENEFGQKLYPRKWLFEQITAVIARSGKSVPVFSDKHLSYDTQDALWMYRRAQQLKLPFMAGSSLPLTWRRPFLEIEKGTRIDEAVAIGYGGIEAYTYHTIEGLQCMVERRKGGETGVEAVEVLQGADVWQAGESGRWNRDLFDMAVDCLGAKDNDGTPEEKVKDPVMIEIHHCDGLKAHVFMLSGYARDWSFAYRSGDEQHACEFHTQAGESYAHFSYLGLNVEEMFVTGRPQYPVERTLLVSCVLDAFMHARKCSTGRAELPDIDIQYEAPDEVRWRPTGPRPAGACIEPWVYRW